MKINKRAVFLLFCFFSLISSAETVQVYRFMGTGVFSVVYKTSKTTQNCSRVLVEIIESDEQIHLETRFNCEESDDGEDQEFVPVTLNRKNEKLYFNNKIVGTYKDHILYLKFQVGKQVEIYDLNFQTPELNYFHSANLGTPGTGVLSGILPLLTP